MSHSLWQTVSGIVQPGHRVASGTTSDSPYPRGTIEMQLPFFQALGLDLSGYFRGTLNLSLSPHTFQLVRPEFTFRAVAWTDLHPPEDFSFSRCRLIFESTAYDSLIYFPHPETKARHFQNPSVVEVMAPPIANLSYGSQVELDYNPLELVVNPG